MRSSTLIASALFAVLSIGLAEESSAQTGCRTANCFSPTAPPGCESRATPRTLRVLMEGNGVTIPFRFTPSAPKIEPGECVEWFPSTVTHSSSGSACPDTGGLCDAPPPPCTWETGNASAGFPSVFCHYDEGTFPAASTNGYYCRIHATPTSGTMRGDLRVTTAIALTVSKDTAAGDVLLDWTGGGVPGDESFVVVLEDADPRFPTPTNQTPTGGPTGRSFRDVGQASQPGNRFYLVRNRQSNE